MAEDKKPLILSVEDDESMLLLLERMLTVGGYEVRPFSDSAKALDWLKTGRPDLILTDVMMPKTSGYEFCAQLQADPELSLIPVIFLTALDTAQDKAKALTAGAVDYLTKPIDKKNLLAVVGRHARTKGQWAGLKEGLVAAAWAPQDEDRLRFQKHLRDTLGSDKGLNPAQMAEQEAAFCHLTYLPHINPETIQLGVLPAPFCRANRVIAIEDTTGRAFVVGDPFNKELFNLLGRYAAEGAAPRILITEPANITMLLKRPDKEGIKMRLGADLEQSNKRTK